jgi:far upstream element-binding protein
MTIDTAHVGMVIGRGGDTLRRIERETGARVQFAPGNLPMFIP